MKRLNLITAISLFPLAILGVAGCASTVVLETTKQVATHVDDLNRNLVNYQKVLEKDAKRRVEMLAAQRVSLASLEFDLKERLAIWNLIDRKWAEKLFAGVQKISADQVAADRDLADRLSRELKELQSSQKKYANQSRALTALSQQLQELATQRDLKTQLKFLVEFGKEAVKKGKELEEEQDAQQ